MKLTLKEVAEGKTRLIVPSPDKYRDPAHAGVFYNPKMEFDRSLSVRVLNEFLGEGAKVADILAGTGARAVRYANEGRKFEVWANDIQPSALELVRKNAEINGIGLKISGTEANSFLLENKKEYFDCIDIDPFGSPIHFILNAGKAIRPKGSLLCATATDTGALSGSFPKACYRKYAFNVERNSMAHEVGVRGLIGAILRELTKHDLSIEPLLAYSRLHYYRVYLKVVPGTKRANRAVKQLAFLSWCPKCDRRSLSGIGKPLKQACECGLGRKVIGPIWGGELGDQRLASSVNDGGKILGALSNEVSIDALHFNLHYMGRCNGLSSPRVTKTMERLSDMGHRASRTHYNDNGIKTTAAYDEVLEAIRP